MDIKNELYKQIDRILNMKNFDIINFYYNFRRMVSNLYKFHNVIGKDVNDTYKLSKLVYDIPKETRPKEGQICYFYIENSYPKEIYNSHWCLILKDFGNTMIVVPLVSIKAEANPVDVEREFIIKIKDFEETGCSKAKVQQIFSADTMRIDLSRKIYDLQTDFNYVKNNIKKILNIY